MTNEVDTTNIAKDKGFQMAEVVRFCPETGFHQIVSTHTDAHSFAALAYGSQVCINTDMSAEELTALISEIERYKDGLTPPLGA